MLQEPSDAPCPASPPSALAASSFSGQALVAHAVHICTPRVSKHWKLARTSRAPANEHLIFELQKHTEPETYGLAAED